jgi:ribosome-binding factor A
MRNDLRKIPELEFYLDETLDYLERIGDLFDKIKKEETDIKKNPEIGD